MKWVSLAEWLTDNGYVASREANRICIGEILTPEKAVCVRKILKRAYLDRLGIYFPVDMIALVGESNMRFLAMLTDVIAEGIVFDTNWCDMLYDTMTPEDLNAIRNMMNNN